jgi:hypothetical protein
MLQTLLGVSSIFLSNKISECYILSSLIGKPYIFISPSNQTEVN